MEWFLDDWKRDFLSWYHKAIDSLQWENDELVWWYWMGGSGIALVVSVCICIIIWAWRGGRTER